MCDFGIISGPMIVSMGVAAASAATSIAGQVQQQSAQKSYQKNLANASQDQVIETRKRATEDYLRNVRLEQLQSTQEHEAVVEKSGDIAQQTRATSATAVASAAERGVSGRSIDQVIQSYHFQQDTEIGRLRANQTQKDMQHNEQIKGMATQFDQRATSVKPYIPSAVAPVDYFSPILGIASAGMNTGAATGAFKSTT